MIPDITLRRGTVWARKMVSGEDVCIGSETHSAGEDDWLVTHPSGRKSIVSGRQFDNRYEPTDQPNIFRVTRD